jgi:hypothetical protein
MNVMTYYSGPFSLLCAQKGSFRSAVPLRAALIAEKGWKEEQLPSMRTLGDVLNRLGYRLRAVAKTRPEKKRPKPTPSSPT